MERWLPIAGAPGYEVSDHGRVRRTIKVWRYPPRILRGTIYKGYHCVFIPINGKKRRTKIHRLVCSAFKGAQPSPRHVVAHRDHNKQNNHHKNLRWLTQRENVHETIAAGRQMLPWGRMTK